MGDLPSKLKEFKEIRDKTYSLDESSLRRKDLGEVLANVYFRELTIDLVLEYLKLAAQKPNVRSVSIRCKYKKETFPALQAHKEILRTELKRIGFEPTKVFDVDRRGCLEISLFSVVEMRKANKT